MYGIVENRRQWQALTQWRVTQHDLATVTAEERTPSQRSIDDCPEREDIAGDICVATPCLFGRHVTRSSNDSSLRERSSTAKRLRNSEIEYFPRPPTLAVFMQENISWIYIPMDDSCPVYGIQTQRYLRRELHSVVE